mgnify:CR=1 FL=1
MISANNVTYRVGKKALFEDVNIKFTEGNCYGLIGANGAGKSTFLKILSGQLDTTKGDIVITPGQRLSVLEQDHFKYDDNVVMDTVIMGNERLFQIMKEKDAIYAKEDFSDEDGIRASELEAEFAEMDGWEAESNAAMLLNGLGIGTEFHYSLMKDLDGSLKVKVLLAKALFGNPDILLLDEPTNHLDLPTIEWLEGYLKTYDKAVIIVSHDRMFLDKVIDVTYEIEYHEIKRYAGNYTAFIKQKEEALIKQEKDYEEQQKEIKRLTDWIEKWKNTPTKVAATRSKRMAIEHMVKIEKPRHFDTKAFHARYVPRMESYTNVIHAKNLEIGYDTVLSKVSFLLQKKDRLAIIGENGKGKSTLLKTLVGELPALGGEFSFGQNVEWSYFDQQKAVQEHFREDQTVLENFWEEYPSYMREEVRSALGGFLFSGEDVEKKMGQLSGGEKVRLALCKMLQTKPNLLILDEPTNHMDIVGKEALEQMLREYEGTVLFVSHDRYFISRIATGILEFSESGVKQYAMSYEEYLAEKQKEMEISGKGRGMSQSARYVSGNDTQNSVGNEKHNQHQSGIKTDADVPTLTDVFDKKTYYNPGKIRSRLQHQLEKYEKMLEESEEKLAEIKMQFMDPELASDYPKLMELQNALDAEEKNQESLLERMLETETELAEFEEE